MTFDLARTLLVIVVLVLTGLLLIIGGQLFLILREVRQAIQRINDKLDEEKRVGFFKGLSQIQEIFEEEVKDGGEREFPHIQALKERGRRFFTKSGKPLG